MGQQLFDSIANGLTSKKARILVTHQLQFMNKVDHIIILEQGKILAEGTFEELIKRQFNFAGLHEDYIKAKEVEAQYTKSEKQVLLETEKKKKLDLIRKISRAQKSKNKLGPPKPSTFNSLANRLKKSKTTKNIKTVRATSTKNTSSSKKNVPNINSKNAGKKSNPPKKQQQNGRRGKLKGEGGKSGIFKNVIVLVCV